ncbi:hypothetical protein [Guptibacillus spartinae]|uniref:hypothetical protein n=1 Tax=Guptibacillus spartinae TaxID=3025679 RepID=UPI002362F667|nr:hypothetical protein [Pseudalkalibacillus spartinae]
MDLNTIIWIPILTAVITTAFNVIFHFLKSRLDWFVDKKKFKREHNYNQLKELYLYLYAIVVQSEYVRYFLKKYNNINSTQKGAPFLQIEGNIRRFKDGKLTEEDIKNDITNFSKLEIANVIIEKSKFASPKLLKLAVAYRLCDHYYLKDFDNDKTKNNFQVEEVKLIYLIVQTIIKECNEFLKECDMEFDKKEMSNAIMNYKVFESNDEDA